MFFYMFSTGTYHELLKSVSFVQVHWSCSKIPEDDLKSTSSLYPSRLRQGPLIQEIGIGVFSPQKFRCISYSAYCIQKGKEGESTSTLTFYSETNVSRCVMSFVNRNLQVERLWGGRLVKRRTLRLKERKGLSKWHTSDLDLLLSQK